MKTRWCLVGILMLALCSGAQLHGQQPDTQRKLFEQIKVKAETGDTEAQNTLGLCYGNGIGVATNAVEAVEWYRKAAEQTNALAQYNLGCCYANGKGVAKDDVTAVKWYRKAAEQALPAAQYNLGVCYTKGQVVAKDDVEAVKWFRKAAEQALPAAQFILGSWYHEGQGVAKDDVEAVKWFRKAADQGLAQAQFSVGSSYFVGNGVEEDTKEGLRWWRRAADQDFSLAEAKIGDCYAFGEGVPKDYVEAVEWYRKAAEQGDAPYAQLSLGTFHANGTGVPKNYVEAYKWLNLAAAQGISEAKSILSSIESSMTPAQIAEAQRRSAAFIPRKTMSDSNSNSDSLAATGLPNVTGSGFFITEDGFLVTNEHVVKAGVQVRVVTAAGIIAAKVVKLDPANDLALLQAEGKFVPLPVIISRSVRLGNTVATVGFPNIGLQGFAPKLAKGEIAALSGAQDDARYFQISVPVQPGNSGGALVDERGNVVGVVSAKLSARAALAASGALPENVNYAVKSSFLLGFLESMPEVSAKLKEPNTKERKFEDVVKSAE
jgi:TPR repeat protein